MKGNQRGGVQSQARSVMVKAIAPDEGDRFDSGRRAGLCLP